jgi:hypothetical protein
MLGGLAHRLGAGPVDDLQTADDLGHDRLGLAARRVVRLVASALAIEPLCLAELVGQSIGEAVQDGFVEVQGDHLAGDETDRMGRISRPPVRSAHGS